MHTKLSASSIAPIIACVLSLIRYFIPIREVLSVRKESRLGELNPFPFAATILNTTGWLVYAIITENIFVYSSEAPGLLCSIWMTLSLYPFANLQVQNRINGFLMTAAALWCCLALATLVMQDTPSANAITPLWGWSVSVTQVLLMASPLLTLYKAIKQRSSASFHLGLCVMGLVTSTMWSVYALAIHDMFIMVPNLLGAVLSFASVLVCFVLSRVAPRTPAEAEQTRVRAVEQAMELG